MQDLEWIKDNLDYYEQLVSGIERLDPESIKTIEREKFATIKKDINFIESEAEQLMSKFIQTLEVQPANSFGGRVSVRMLRNKIYMLEACIRKLNELQERVNWATMV